MSNDEYIEMIRSGEITHDQALRQLGDEFDSAVASLRRIRDVFEEIGMEKGSIHAAETLDALSFARGEWVRATW